MKKNGFLTIKIPQKIRNLIVIDIKNICIKKLSKSKHTKKNIENIKFSNISKLISDLSDEKFLEFFGHSSFRIFSPKVTISINEYIKKNLAKVLDKKKVSLHYVANHEIKKNKLLKKKQFLGIFRVVRPNKNDVTFPHRDYDFGKIYNKYYKSPFKIRNRFKVWIPIWGCDNSNSLRLYKKSHLNKKIIVKYILKQKRPKPVIGNSFFKENKNFITQPIKNFKSSAIVFDDKLVHFAPKNDKRNIRISSEFTIVTN